jgi:PIN domain nuclease of toxin-antitoxin system
MILLDTHALIWAVNDSKELSRRAAFTIRRARLQSGLAVSAITVWELAVLLTKGRIRAYGTVEASIRLFLEGVAVRPITPEIAALAAQFPDDYSRDPSDRLIGGTARAEGLTLITRNENMRRSPLLKAVW